MPFLATTSLPSPAMAMAPKAPNMASCAVAATNESFSCVTPEGRPQERRNLKQLQSVLTRRNVKLRRANVSAAANTTDHDSIAREARTRSGLVATGAATFGGGAPRAPAAIVTASRRTRQQSFQPLEHTRLFILHQDAIASYASRSFEVGQRGGARVDWLGTNAPYRCFAV
jgi:hypothetical protein